MRTQYRHSTLRTSLIALAAVVACIALQAAPASAQITVTGTIDSDRSFGVLTGERGFSLVHEFTLNDNFIGLGPSGCNGYPGQCTPGSTVSLQTVLGDLNWSATLDGVSYPGGCANCLPGLTFQTTGSVVLPPIAPTATATGRFTMSGTLYLYPQTIPFSGSGTATLYLHSPGVPGYPNSWHVDRAVLRFDSSMPAPWSDVDVGSVGIAGTTTPNGTGSFIVSGAGSDIWGTSDAFHYALAFPSGSEIVARVDSEQNTNPYAKAGVTFRSSMYATASHVLLDVKPDGGVELLYRATDGGSTTYVGGASARFPVWLKLSQAGGTTASMSSDGQTWQTIGSVPLTGGLPGLAVTSHDPSQLNQAAFSAVSVAPDPNTPASSGWQQADIGNVTAQGSGTISGTQATVSADGADIWGAADAFRYVYESLPFDGEMIARVTSLQNTSVYAKAGVMLRASTSATSPHVMLDVKPDGGIELLARTSDGGTTTFVAGGSQVMPAWLKLQRRGGTVVGWSSSDGTNWTMVGSIDVPNLTGGFIGLAVTSHAPGVLTTATFDSIDVNVLQPPPSSSWFDRDIGTTGLAGRTYWADGTFTVQGAGADVWGAADSFHLLLSASSDPTRISARVTSETNTNPYAKAGVMLRNGYVAGSAFVMIDVKPNGEIEVLQRAVDGGQASYVAGTTAGFPTFLRLDRAGTNVTASYSADGSTWTPLATVPITWTGNPARYGGLAVTSHDMTVLNTSVFDNVVVAP